MPTILPDSPRRTSGAAQSRWGVLCLVGLFATLWTALAAAAPNQVFIDRGILEYDEKNFPAALENFQKAVELDPEDPNARYFTGLALIALDRFDEAVTQLSRGRALDPNDLNMVFALGAALFSTGAYDQALPHFQAVATEEPRRENLGYYLGFIHYQKKEYEQALGFLEGNVAEDPAFQQLTRFYAALAKHQLGRDVEAAEALSHVVALRPASPIALTARKFRDVIAPPPPEPKRFRAELRFGYQYDDNVRVAPTSNALDLKRPERRSTGQTVLARGELDALRLGSFTTTVSYQFYAIFNDNIDEFGIKDHRPGIESIYRAALFDRPLTTGLRYDVDILYQNDRKQSKRDSVQPYGVYGWADWTDTTLFYRYQINDSKTAPTRGLRKERQDSYSHDVGLVQAFYYGAHVARVGYTHDTERAEGADNTYGGHKLSAGLQLTLPWNFTFDTNFEYHSRDYPADNALIRQFNTDQELGAPFRSKRRDWDQTLLLTLAREIPLPKALPGSLTTSLEYFRARNVSTISIYDYVRDTVSLNVTWRY